MAAVACKKRSLSVTDLDSRSVAKSARTLVPADVTTPVSSIEFDVSRVRAINNIEMVSTARPVVYCKLCQPPKCVSGNRLKPPFYITGMSRHQHSRDNWALFYAQSRAMDMGAALGIV